jgi:hypothetical protein
MMPPAQRHQIPHLRGATLAKARVKDVVKLKDDLPAGPELAAALIVHSDSRTNATPVPLQDIFPHLWRDWIFMPH